MATSGGGDVSLHGLVLSSDNKGAYKAIPEVDPEQETRREVPGRTSEDLCRLASRVGLVLVVVILLAIYGQRASRIDQIQAASGPDGTIDVAVSGEQHLPQLRPCQILLAGTDARRPQVLQTSRSQPSAQWSEVACFESFDTGSSWELIGSLFRGGGRRLSRAFGLPSAIIKVNFSQPMFTDRSPILGFGGAFTEASALNYNRLSEAGKQAYMELMFGESGLGYKVGRVHMNSCDFSVKSYSFDDVDGDFDLSHFDTRVKHDVDSGMVGMIQDAQTVAGSIKMYASPWSPPAWMKQPTYDDPPGAAHAASMTGSTVPTCLRDGVGPESPYAKAWALYFSKFISAYKNQSIDFWGVTVQNEPEFPAPWEACAYSKFTQGDFIQYHLGPTLERDHPDVKLFVFDHNKDHAPEWAAYLMNSTTSGAAKYIDGTAYHWYAGGMDRLLDGGVGSANMHQLLATLEDKPDQIVFGSEACHCPSTGYAGGDLAVGWARAERYAHTVLADLAAGSNAWVEWNLLLDERGGPNHLGNLCDAPVLAVPQRAKDVPQEFLNKMEPMEPKAQRKFDPVTGDMRTRAELHAMGNPAEMLDVGLVVQPMYYYMGHISRHVPPGTRAVPALVDGGRPFRPADQVVPGGGINDLARVGVEATLWPCEGSTRQSWTKNDLGQLQVFGHDWLGEPTTSCLANSMSADFNGIVLSDCNVTHAAAFDMVPLEPLNKGIVQLVTSNHSCLMAKPLMNDGGANGPRGGAQVKYGNCSDSASHWSYSEATGELTTSFLGGDPVCLTTGWPFLQVGAFDNHVVVVLNEANDAANFIIQDGDTVVMTSSIPAHSIQTILL